MFNEAWQSTDCNSLSVATLGCLHKHVVAEVKAEVTKSIRDSFNHSWTGKRTDLTWVHNDVEEDRGLHGHVRALNLWLEELTLDLYAISP